ncbi:MAG TPA: prephenate dehydratase domain-containing protein [Solirubrobacteraceae bacterium]|jgi:prephenate dehydratase
MRVGYFGPEGTFTHEALLAAGLQGSGSDQVEQVPLPTIYDAVMAVHDGIVDRVLVPIENSLEGSVNATLDTLAMETEDVAILGEVVHPIRHCLIARTAIELEDIEVVISHPQASAQCARFIRTRLPQAQVRSGGSTAEAVRSIAAEERPWAALGNRAAAARYGCVVLRAGVEDVAGNETRFVWLGPVGAPPGGPAGLGRAADRGSVESPAAGAGGLGDETVAGGLGDDAVQLGPWKTAIVFWGVGSEAPGWLVACLSEFADRGVNLTRIESRPRKQGLGRYMFFVDMEGRDTEPHVAAGLEGLRAHVEALRVLGSFPAA